MRGNWWLIFGNILFFSISYIHIKRVVLYILLNFSDEYIKYGFKFLTLVNCKYAKSDKSMELSFISWHKILKTSWTAWRCPWKKIGKKMFGRLYDGGGAEAPWSPQKWHPSLRICRITSRPRKTGFPASVASPSLPLIKTVPANSWLFIYFRKYWNLQNIV